MAILPVCLGTYNDIHDSMYAAYGAYSRLLIPCTSIPKITITYIEHLKNLKRVGLNNSNIY